MAIDVLPLNPFWKFLDPIISETIKNLIKPKSSDDKAKEKAFELYKVLSDINKSTDKFVASIQSLHKAISEKEPSDTITFSEQTVSNNCSMLLITLDQLVKALKNINPQLEIHKLELVKNINNYIGGRYQLLDQWERSPRFFNDFPRVVFPVSINSDCSYKSNESELIYRKMTSGEIRRLMERGEKDYEILSKIKQEAIKDYENYPSHLLVSDKQNSDIILNAKEDFYNFLREESLRLFMIRAEKNRDLIQKATEDYRNFLKEEFSFKDSF